MLKYDVGDIVYCTPFNIVPKSGIGREGLGILIGRILEKRNSTYNAHCVGERNKVNGMEYDLGDAHILGIAPSHLYPNHEKEYVYRYFCPAIICDREMKYAHTIVTTHTWEDLSKEHPKWELISQGEYKGNEFNGGAL